MSHHSTKSLIRRVEALEGIVLKATPQKRDRLLAMAIAAMVGAWTPDEVEQILVATEQSQLTNLPADLRRRWVRSLDRISMQRFGKTFGALLAAPPSQHQRTPKLHLAGLILPAVERKEDLHVR